ncbi:MAG: hypothetical protein HeimC3_04530 [Candidatus Heimdallarchaeota archaeon LC_3]|nr:MAG: hypothetical protein HeimC3_04530 [Candidatus Heimdallarchaeota archaeon LC_3]
MLDSSIILFISRVFHIIGFTLGLAMSFSLLLLYLIIRKNKNLLDIMKLIRLLILFQIITNIISTLSGIFRLNFTTVIQDQSKLTIFIPKMIVFSLSLIIIIFLFYLFSKFISDLATQPYRNNSLTSKQDKISVIFLFINMILMSLAFLLGGSLVIF